MNLKFYLGLFLFSSALNVHASSASTYEQGISLYKNKNYKEALEIFTTLDIQGDINASNILGDMYLRGTGTDIDLQKAEIYLTKAADKGHAGAQNRLGLILLDKNEKKNLEHAYELFKKSATTNEYGAWNAARIILDSDILDFTEESLKISLEYAKKAKAMGHSQASTLAGSLECALNGKSNLAINNSLLKANLLAHYEAKGSVRVLEHKNRYDNEKYFFGKGGHLLKAEFKNINIQHRYIYDSNCDLIRWEVRKYSDAPSKKYKITNFENYEYSQGRLMLTKTPLFGGEEFRHSYYQQADKGYFEEKKKIDAEYSSNSYKKYNSKGFLEWLSWNEKPYKYWAIYPGAGITYSRVLNEGSSRMRFQGGQLFFYNKRGKLISIRDDSSEDLSTQSVIEYKYHKNGWVESESLLGSLRERKPIKNVTYLNYILDEGGNWTSRTQKYNYDETDMTETQTRVLLYY